MKYRPDIDGLRALAVCAVLGNHLALAGFGGGYLGVDVFFVISGFLITTILLREIGEGRFSLVRFYERRARRILPALFAVIAFCFASGWFLMSPDQYDSLGKSAVATLLFASNLWFMDQSTDYFAVAPETQPLLHTWSLGVEEQFYIVFPLLLMALATRRRWLGPTLVGLCLISFAGSLWAVRMRPEMAFFFTPVRVWELGLGAAVAMWGARAVTGRLSAEVLTAVGLAATLLPVVLYDKTTPFPGLAALPPCLGAAAIIWVGQHRQTAAARLLSVPVVVGVGLISYSLYLWHWPLIVLAYTVTPEGPLSGEVIAWVAGSSVLLAWLSWRYVEQPFRRTPPHGPGMKAVFAAGGVGTALLAGFALFVVRADGLDGRLPAEAQQAFAAAKETMFRAEECRREKADSPFCEIGDPNSARGGVLVWGDSHAGSLGRAMDGWLKDKGLPGKLAFKLGCPPALGVLRLDRRDDQSCADYNAKVLQALHDDKSIRQVVLFARWALLAEGTRPEGEVGGDVVLGSAATGTAQDGNRTILFDGLRRTLAEIPAHVDRVILVESIPEIGWSVPQALGRAALHDVPAPAAPARRDAEARNRWVSGRMVELARNAGAEFAPVLPLFCDTVCSPALDGAPLYRDDDHLSDLGARHLIDRVLAQRLLPDPVRLPR